MKISIIILSLFIAACSPVFYPVCRHDAMLAAITVGEKYPTRIVSGRSGEDARHAQAQAYIDRTWHWLEVRNGWVYVGDQDNFEPDSYFFPEQYFDKAFKDKLK